MRPNKKMSIPPTYHLTNELSNGVPTDKTTDKSTSAVADKSQDMQSTSNIPFIQPLRKWMISILCNYINIEIENNLFISMFSNF